MAEEERRDIPGVTRPYTFNEAAIAAKNLVDDQIARGLTPEPVPLAFTDPVWPSPDGKGVIYWDPFNNRHVITAHDRSNVQTGSAVSSGLTGAMENTNPTFTLPPGSQN